MPPKSHAFIGEVFQIWLKLGCVVLVSEIWCWNCFMVQQGLSATHSSVDSWDNNIRNRNMAAVVLDYYMSPDACFLIPSALCHLWYLSSLWCQSCLRNTQPWIDNAANWVCQIKLLSLKFRCWIFKGKTSIQNYMYEFCHVTKSISWATVYILWYDIAII